VFGYDSVVVITCSANVCLDRGWREGRTYFSFFNLHTLSNNF